MESTLPLIGLLAWLQVKHFVADYLLQTAWILHGKGDLRHLGGYVHAAIHVGGTVPGLVMFGLDGATVLVLALSEFAVHFIVDHCKAVYSRRDPAAVTTRRFWAAHGADQLLHHLTYTGILAVAA
jgi:hypothetical protein